MQNTPPPLDALLQEVHWLRRLCQALTRSGEDADDLTQDVLDQALQQRPALETREIGLRGWLATVARRRAARVRAKARARTNAEATAASATSEAPGQEPSPQERTHDYAVLQRDLAAAVAELPEADRTILVARYLEVRPYRQIAAELGISVDTARHRCSRALQRLRTDLEQDDQRWSQWLPAIAAGAPYIPNDPTGTSSPLTASTQKLVAIAATITLITVGVWVASRMTTRTAQDLHVATGPVSLAQPRELGTSDHTDRLASPPPATTTSQRKLIQTSPPADFQLRNEDGEPIRNARALWITALSHQLVNAAVDSEGYGRIELPRDGEPIESGVLFVVADGYLGRPYYGLLVADKEMDLLTMEPAKTLRLVLDCAQPAAIPPYVQSSIVVGPNSVAASPLLERPEVREDLRRRLFPDGLVIAKKIASTGEASTVYDLKLIVNTPALYLNFSDGLRVAAGQGPGVRVSPSRGTDIAIWMDEVSGSNSTIRVGLEALPHIDLTFIFEGGEPFRGRVRPIRFFPLGEIDLGSSSPADETGRVRVATARRGDNDFEEVRDSALEKIWLNFVSHDGLSIDHIELTADQLSTGPRTVVLPRPRTYHLHFVDPSAEVRTPVNARVFGARDRGVGRTALDAKGSLTSSALIHGLPGDMVSIAAPGFRVENLSLPPSPFSAAQPADVVVRLQPHPTFEITYNPEKLRGAKISLTSVDGTAPMLTFSKTEGLSADRNYSSREAPPTHWLFEASATGKTIIPGVRPDHALEVCIVDLFGRTLLKRTCKLVDSPIDFTDESAELVRITGSVTDARGDPIATGLIKIDYRNGMNQRTVPFVAGIVDIGLLKPDRYKLTGESWDGLLRTEKLFRFNLTKEAATRGTDRHLRPIVLTPKARLETPKRALARPGK